VKKYLVAGLLVWLPLAITVALLSWLLGTMDSLFAWVLHLLLNVLPASAKGVVEGLVAIPGLGVVVVLVALFLTGVFAANVLGAWAVHRWHDVMHRVPIVKSIYSSVKQVSDTLFSSSGQAFREAVLVQYPRQGAWTIAFVTGKPGGEVVQHLPEDCVSVYVPTTPNPTSGFFLMLPRRDVVALKMSVDEALKYVISMGVVAPAMAGGNGRN
jgi:uncharacterized membrane protein